MSISPAKLDRQRALLAARDGDQVRGQAGDPHAKESGGDPQARELRREGVVAARSASVRCQASDSTRALACAGGEAFGSTAATEDYAGSAPTRPHGRRSPGVRRGGSRSAPRSPSIKLTQEEEIAIERLAAERSVEGAARAEAAAARAAVRASMAKQAPILEELAAGGVPFTLVAHRLGLLAGRPASVSERRRLARGLCKRRQRAQATAGRMDLPAPPPSPATAPISSEQTTDAAKGGEESSMAQLVKRTITEEYTTVEEDFDDIEDMDEDDEEAEDEQEAAPSRRSKR